ncbi:DUF3311 domain-containing protein [Bacillus altitudinis]|uniref:DUF3311 domain-containing protein n=1 Tax=Bacillus altitudinis TaxID=293387 RepID=UPI0011E92A8B|nr:DUF3311 domain-containing protein [Bacillus altitudinis]TYS27059.1 DUF3311 domain-containing protein [Bacillus altitudinis]
MNKKLLLALLIAIPFIGQLVLLPFVNRIQPFVIGLPFFHFWLLLWIVLTPVCTFIIYRMQHSNGGTDECKET